jgi:hypothetical protein
MNEATFWSIYALLPPLERGNSRAVASCLETFVESMDIFELAVFDRLFENFILAAYRTDIFHALTARLGAPLDDAKLRSMICGVMALGQDRYEAMLQNPSTLLLLTQVEIESMDNADELYWRISEYVVPEDWHAPDDTQLPALLISEELPWPSPKERTSDEFPTDSPWDHFPL